MGMNKQELLEIKNTIEEAKKEVSELQGKKKYLLQELNEQWGCKSIEDGLHKIAEMEKQVAEIEEKIDNKIRMLKNEYDL